jgi:diadenosine tetraphosphate (Ap4A) HIT family hydrolase
LGNPEVHYHLRELDPADPVFGAVRAWPNQWPSDWAQRLAGAGCPMCASLGQDDPSSVLVDALGATDVRLQRRSRFPGYCVVIWNQGHVVDPADLDDHEAIQYWADVRAVGRALRAVFNPVKLNYLTLGNSVPHPHTHILPRYLEDPADGGPIPAELMLGTDVGPPAAVLEEQAAQIRAALDSG